MFSITTFCAETTVAINQFGEKALQSRRHSSGFAMCEIEVAISEENELPQCGATRLRGGRLSSEYCGGRNFALPQDCLRKQTCSTRPPVNKKWYHTHSRKHTLARTNTRIHTLVSNWILTSCRNTHTHTHELFHYVAQSYTVFPCNYQRN